MAFARFLICKSCTSLQPRILILFFMMLTCLSACSGITQPMESRYGNGLQPSELEKANSITRNPYQYALEQEYLWDQAGQHIQHGNTASIVSLTSLSALVAYRAARNHNGAATAVMAATGLVGLSLSDALVITSRLNIYNKGIQAMECSINAYSAAGGILILPADSGKPDEVPGVEMALRHVNEGSPTAWGVQDLADEIRVRLRSLKRQVDPPFAKTVSRIVGEVDDALLGTLVSAHDLASSWHFSMPQQQTNSEGTPSSGKKMVTQAAKSAQAGILEQKIISDMKPAEQGDPAARKELTTGLAALHSIKIELDAQEQATSLSASDYIQALNACSIISFAPPPKPQSTQDLKINWAAGSPPIAPNKLAAQKYTGQISGGTSPYIVLPVPKAAGTLASGFSATLDPQDGSKIVIDATKLKPGADAEYYIFVSDAKSSTLSPAIDVVVPKTP